MLNGLPDKASAPSNKDDVGHSMALRRTSGKISQKNPQRMLTFVLASGIGLKMGEILKC
jgi:hypothetical protein